jgi:putative transposase
MAAATSPATGQAYGVRRVCAIWGVARSSFYDARRQQGRQSPVGRPGPKPALSDAELLAAIRRDLARSPWTGEGHRKVWARLRVIDGIRVSRTVRRTTTTARSPPMRRT